MRSVIAGFLKDDSMESRAGRRKDMHGILACRAWIPLEHREAVLAMQEIAVCVEKRAVPAGFGLRKTRHRKCHGLGFRKGFMTRAGSVADERLCSRLGGAGIVRLRRAQGLGLRGEKVRWQPVSVYIQTRRWWMFRRTRRTRGTQQRRHVPPFQMDRW